MNTNNNCNTVCTFQRLFGEEVAIQNDQGKITINEPCWHHCCNSWFGGGIKALSKHLSTFHKDDLDNIDSCLQITTTVDAFFQAMDKGFSKTNNYAKGDGNNFHKWMDRHHLGALLFNTEQAVGSG